MYVTSLYNGEKIYPPAWGWKILQCMPPKQLKFPRPVGRKFCRIPNCGDINNGLFSKGGLDFPPRTEGAYRVQYKRQLA